MVQCKLYVSSDIIRRYNQGGDSGACGIQVYKGEENRIQNFGEEA